MSRTCKRTDHESVSTQYHRYQRYRHKKKLQIKILIMSRYQYDIDSQFYLARSEILLEPSMNRYRHDIVDINNTDTKKNNFLIK
jgi:hypothetical protein